MKTHLISQAILKYLSSLMSLILLILGSLLVFLVMLLYLPIINQRIKEEEPFLEKNLEGYQEYKNHSLPMVTKKMTNPKLAC